MITHLKMSSLIENFNYLKGVVLVLTGFCLTLAVALYVCMAIMFNAMDMDLVRDQMVWIPVVFSVGVCIIESYLVCLCHTAVEKPRDILVSMWGPTGIWAGWIFFLVALFFHQAWLNILLEQGEWANSLAFFNGILALLIGAKFYTVCHTGAQVYQIRPTPPPMAPAVA